MYRYLYRYRYICVCNDLNGVATSAIIDYTNGYIDITNVEVKSVCDVYLDLK